jgi:membrane carboxypeptidase/penicillin-binding protein PbpC
MRAFGERSVLDIDQPAAVKTGTTTDWRDNWTIGYTPDRVVGVWVGNADGQPMENVSGISGAGPAWHEVMLAAHRGIPARPFERPEGIVERAICADSGLLPSDACPATRMERFIQGTQPTRPDDTHIALAVDLDRDCRAPAGYPAERTVTRTFRLLPAEAEAWAADAGLPRIPPDICPIQASSAPVDPNPRPSAPSLGAAPALLTPAPGAVFALSPGVPRQHQRLELHAQAGGTAAQLTILVDDEPLATFDAPPYRAFWQMEPGAHRALVLVEDSSGQQQRSAPVAFVVLHPEDRDDP